MTLSDLGSIGEFVSSIVVLLTLFYLAVQVRHSRQLLERNEKLALGQAFQARVDSRRDLEKLVIELSDLVVRVGKDEFEQLTESEQLKVRQLNPLWADWWDNNIYQASLGFESTLDLNVDLGTFERVLERWQATGIKPSERVLEWYAQRKREEYQSAR